MSILTAAATPAKADANSRPAQRPRSMIVLACTPAGPQTQKLCQALQQKLAASLPSYVFRVVPELGTVQGRAGDMLINLRIDNLRPNHVEAHLEWRHSTTQATPPTQIGPKVSLKISQTGLTFSAASKLAAALLDGSPEMLTQLKE